MRENTVHPTSDKGLVIQFIKPLSTPEIKWQIAQLKKLDKGFKDLFPNKICF